MSDHFVASSQALEEGGRLITKGAGKEIGIFRNRGNLYAYSNYCLHSGGPACEGLIIAKIEERILPDKTSDGLHFSREDTHFVCPWHGYEYDIQTGEFVGDRRQRLRAYKVVERDGQIFIAL